MTEQSSRFGFAASKKTVQSGHRRIAVLRRFINQSGKLPGLLLAKLKAPALR
jgi:hypothetical protein